MGMWCPRCRSEYVEGVRTCSACGVDLVDARDLPPEPDEVGIDPEDAIFVEPKAARDHEDPFVPIWEGPTTEADALLRLLEAAAIPVDLGEAAQPGRARIEVPDSYTEEAYGLLDDRGFEALLAPPEVPTAQELSGLEGGWPAWARIALWAVVILVILGMLFTSRGF